MRRTARPALELLEGRSLMTVVPSATPGLVDSLTAVAIRAPGGAQVALTFTETNVSNHDITVDHGPSNEGFLVARAGKVVWDQHAGQMLPMFIQVDVLKPGQSVTVRATWDGRSNQVSSNNPWLEGPPLSGTFTVADALDQRAATASVTIPKAWVTPSKPAHPGPVVVVHAMAAAGPRSVSAAPGLVVSPSSS